jgi:hypothetical protein
VLTILLATAAFPAETRAQSSGVFQGRDGTSGTVVELDERTRVYQDPHGNTGTVLDFGSGGPGTQLRTPSGDVRSGATLGFGAPVPPEGITPAPILPFLPHGTIAPRDSFPPTGSGPQAPSHFAPSGGAFGRIGR